MIGLEMIVTKVLVLLLHIYLYNLESKGSLVRVCPFYPQPKHKHITHLDVSAFWFFQDFRDERESK